MKTTIKVKGRDLLNIVRGLKRNTDYDLTKLKADSPLKGQKYSTFLYEGVVFTAPDMKGFDRDFEAGKLKEVTLVSYIDEVTTTDASGATKVTQIKRLDYSSHINADQWKAFTDEERREELEEAQHKANLNRIAKSYGNVEDVVKLQTDNVL